MKNDSPNKKLYAFKPKNSKIKRNELDKILNNISKKTKEEEKNSKETIKNLNTKIYPHQEKNHNKKILYDKQKNMKKNSNSNVKNYSNQKIKNQINEINNNKQAKKFFLNINEEKPQLTSSKKLLNKRKELNNKKISLNLNSSKSKKDMIINDNDTGENSSRSTKQIKPFHMKKDFYIPTVCATLISAKKKNNINSKLDNSFSSFSSFKSTGKGSFKFNEKRKEHIIERCHTMTNSNYHKIINNEKVELSDSLSQGSFNYDKVLNDLNCISIELNCDNNVKELKENISSFSRNNHSSLDKKRKSYQRYSDSNSKSLNQLKQNNSAKIINL